MIDNLLMIIYQYISSDGILMYEKNDGWIVSVALKQFLTQQDEGNVQDA